MRLLLMSVGTLCVVLGFAGIFLPLLPTTPFLLLAAACYAKSSQKFYDWLVNHRWLGPYIRAFRSMEGVPVRIKIKAIAAVWLMMGVSVMVIGAQTPALVILGVCGLGVTAYLLSLPTSRQR